MNWYEISYRTVAGRIDYTYLQDVDAEIALCRVAKTQEGYVEWVSCVRMAEPPPMRPSREWLAKVAELEGGKPVSVGGWIC